MPCVHRAGGRGTTALEWFSLGLGLVLRLYSTVQFYKSTNFLESVIDSKIEYLIVLPMSYFPLQLSTVLILEIAWVWEHLRRKVHFLSEVAPSHPEV
jgi:hypothetical protein